MSPAPDVRAGVVQASLVDELSPRRLHAMLALRSSVFVVEQNCAYPDADDRDLEAGTRHLWIEEDGAVVAYCRLLEEPDGAARIGRVCVAASVRGRGLAGRLMADALARCAGRPVVLQAQAYLADWYAGYGFVPVSEVYLEDGIEHVDMRRS